MLSLYFLVSSQRAVINVILVMDKKTKNVIKIILINLAAMCAVVFIICYAVFAWLDSYTLHGQVIDVPAVCGMHIDDASEALRNADLDYEVVDYKYKKGAAENEVVEQHPLRGAQVKKGRRIQLTLNSANEPMQNLPDIVDNCSLREAEARLRAAGFKLTEGVRVPGETDWVYSVLLGADTLKNGAKVPMGATLTLVVGSGEDLEVVDEPVMEDSWFE